MGAHDVNLAEETAMRVTIAFLFRQLGVSVEEAQDEIVSGLNPQDWNEDGRRRVRGIVGQLLTGGRDGQSFREIGAVPEKIERRH
jgi:hypothetical protein